MKKIIGFTLLGITLLTLLFIWLYSSMVDERNEKHAFATNFALENTDIVEVTHVETFSGEQVVQVVYGLNDREQRLMMWLFEDGDFLVRFASTGISKNEARELLKQSVAGAEVKVLRTTAGVLDEEYVWEIFYKQKEDETYRYYYRYYRFNDGTLLETLRLDKED